MAAPINDPCFLHSFVSAKLYSSEILGWNMVPELAEGKKKWISPHAPPLRMRRGRRVEEGFAVSPSTGSGTRVFSIIVKLSAVSVVSPSADEVLDYGYQITL